MLSIDLSGRRALVTGGNSGIGAAIVDALAAAGADVAINFVSHPEAAEEGAGRVRAAGGRALTLAADVSDAAAVGAMQESLMTFWTRHLFGRPMTLAWPWTTPIATLLAFCVCILPSGKNAPDNPQRFGPADRI